jgi:hypothetical protein
MGVFLADSGLMGEIFLIHILPLLMGNAASGGWDNYCIVVEYTMHCKSGFE